MIYRLDTPEDVHRLVNMLAHLGWDNFETTPIRQVPSSRTMHSTVHNRCIHYIGILRLFGKEREGRGRNKPGAKMIPPA